jgi:AcrR family transcriptional regulator
MTERLTRAQQQQANRTRLMDAAEVLFAERGIHPTSLDQIAAAAGLTKGAIYANFGSKKDLIEAILERRLADDGPAVPQESLAGWAATLGACFESNVAQAEVRRFGMAFIEFCLYGMREESGRGAVVRWLRTVRELNGKEAADLAGGDPPMPVERLAALMTALDIGVAMQHYLDPEGVPADVYTTGLQAIMGREVTPPGDAGSR